MSISTSSAAGESAAHVQPAGSARRTPASIKALAWRLWWRRSRSASCSGLLTPSTSVSSCTVLATTGVPSATAIGDHVGQVVLALHVVVLQRRQPALQRCGGGGHHAGVDHRGWRAARGWRPCVRRCPARLPPARAGCGRSRWRRTVSMVSSASRSPPAGLGQRSRGGGADQRHVAVEDQRGGVGVVQLRHRLLHGVPGAQLRHLARKAHAAAGQRGLHLVGPMAGDDHGARRPQIACGLQDMVQ